MRRNPQRKTILTALIAAFTLSLCAQDEIILNPAELIPSDTGYYIGGVWKDNNEDGVPEFYNGCIDEYGDSHHNESATQQGFTYEKCMIMPDCPSKDEPTIVSVGYIEIGKTKYVGTDSARLCFIISPPLVNLTKIYLELSPDVSSNDQRHIWFYIDYSKDFGETWEATYIKDETISKKGDLHTYDGSIYFEFEEMQAASQAGPIVLRIMSGEQRVKVHLCKITADPYIVSAGSVSSRTLSFRVWNNTILAEEGKVLVFNTLGQLVGSGERVPVNTGIYLVKTDDGTVHKVCIQKQ